MSKDDKPYGKPMTAEQQDRQTILMYVRDKILDPIMPPVKKKHPILGISKTRDHLLINKLADKHTDELMKLIAQLRSL